MLNTVTRSVLNEYYKARSTKPEDQKPKPEAQSPKPKVQRLKSKDQVNMDFGLWVLGFGLWALGLGLWTFMDLKLMPKFRIYSVLLAMKYSLSKDPYVMLCGDFCSHVSP